ncbi:unnamed protein product [Closterium sp. Naga37s-1]|nr:unnamed protein product [Closterium sp. Naga37s-1]
MAALMTNKSARFLRLPEGSHNSLNGRQGSRAGPGRPLNVPPPPFARWFLGDSGGKGQQVRDHATYSVTTPLTA